MRNWLKFDIDNKDLKVMVKSLIKCSLLISLVCCFCTSLLGQETLSRDQAVELTLANNYGIQIAKNNVLLAENSTDKSLNGYNPSVDLSASQSASVGGSFVRTESGENINTFGSVTGGLNGSVGVRQTFIDKERDARLAQLKEILSLSNLQLRQTVEFSLLQLFTAYYEVARLTEDLHLQEQTLDVSKRRLLRVNYQYEYGQGLRLDVLNAQVDVQRDSINFMNTRQELANAQRDLNVVMGRDVGSMFLIDTTVTYNVALDIPEMIDRANKNHIDLLINQKNLDIDLHDFAIIDAGKKPVLSGNASYGVGILAGNKSSFVFQNTRGLNLGLSLSWNLFDGGRRKMQRQNNQVVIESQQILRQQIMQEIERDILNSWESFQNALFVLQAEKANMRTNQLNFERTEEQFNVGQVTSVEFRQAQLNMLDAASSYNAAKYRAKLIEFQLIQLSGGLLDFDYL